MSEPSKEELKEFRGEVFAWMAENKPKDPGFLLPMSFMEVGDERQLEFLREWQFKVYSAGYLGMAWPSEYGGGGKAPIFQNIADQAMRANDTPICFNTIGLGWAGPLINLMGTHEEKTKHLKRILTAEDIWCQGFSEPDHGSDLANAQTRALRDGDEYIVNGQKTWTTFGNYAQYMILLARTDPDAPVKYDGLSFFLVPMDIPGIEARPIRKITGEYGFTETFFDGARIPASCRVGEEGEGWKIAKQTLLFERGAEAGSAGGNSMVRTTVVDLIEQLRDVRRDGKPVLRDPLVRDQLVRAVMEEKALALNTRRAGIKGLTSDYPGSLMLSRKLIGSESARAMRKLAVSLLGADGGLFVGDDDVLAGGFWQRAYLNVFSTTIGGGTSQVQANIVGEKILGLPKS